MKSLKVTFGLLAMALCASISSASAQVTLSGGSDFVSTYVWRGAYCGGASVQPYAELGLGNFAVGSWGSTSLEATEACKEVDFYASYGVGGFSAMVTDYWCGTEGGLYGEGHVFEATLAYEFGENFPLSIGVSTNFSGDDDYSTYIALAYPVSVGDVGLDFGVGITPSAGAYAEDFAVCSVSARVSKAITVTDTFELPLFVDAIVNPDSKQAFLVGGFSLSF
ncbi:MAG: hypothetical protein R3Y44_07325 [Rikenellaceae bacterium]